MLVIRPLLLNEWNYIIKYNNTIIPVKIEQMPPRTVLNESFLLNVNWIGRA
jgi:hypothetical protein